MEESQICVFDWAYCGCAVCHGVPLISASMKMYALCSKKTGGVTTCQEIHKQGYLELRELYILKSNIPRHFLSFHCGGPAKSLLISHPAHSCKRSPDKEEVCNYSPQKSCGTLHNKGGLPDAVNTKNPLNTNTKYIN